MAACPGGAEPLPGITAGTVVLQLTQTALGDVASLLGGLWGELAVQPVIARMSLANLCALNPDDPGPPTFDDLQALATYTVGMNITDPPSLMPQWFAKQVQYHYFQISCRCINPAELIPPRQAVPPMPNEPVYPTDPDSQPQLTRVLRLAQDGGAGQSLLYQGLQVVATHASDLWSWQTPNNTQPTLPTPMVTMQGEGYFRLPVTGAGADFYRDTAGIRTRMVQLPTKYKQRGTLNPRYYGVGSIYWDARYVNDSVFVNSRRESIHYTNQVLASPREWVPVGIGWYLQPGAIVEAYHLLRQPQVPSLPWFQPNADAFQAFSGLSVPSHIVDPPLWPPSSSRFFSLPPAAPP